MPKNSISRRNANVQRKAPPPTPNVNQKGLSNNSGGGIMGNIAGGMASGFGVGTGIEAARGISKSIFGSKENNVSETNLQNREDNGCKMLSEMILKCKENRNDFNDCNNLLQMFSDKCLNK